MEAAVADTAWKGVYEMVAAERIGADLRDKRGLCKETRKTRRWNVAGRHLEVFHVRKKKIDWLQDEIPTC